MAPANPISVLDDQHQVLLDNLRLLKTSMTGGRGSVAAPAILAELRRFAAYHFPTEERLMESYQYPLRDTHAIEHRKGGQHLDRLEKMVREGDNTLAVQLLEGIERWLHEHILHWDRQLSEYLYGKGVR